MLEGRISINVTFQTARQLWLIMQTTASNADFSTSVPDHRQGNTTKPYPPIVFPRFLAQPVDFNHNVQIPGFWTVFYIESGTLQFRLQPGTASGNVTSANVRMYYRILPLDNIPAFPAASALDARFTDVDARISALENRAKKSYRRRPKSSKN